MVKASLYDPAKVYILGNGEAADLARVQEDFPAAGVIKFVVMTDESGECMLAMDPLSRRKSQLDIDPAATDEEALEIIEAIENSVPEPPPPSPEERMAAAMEFQNMMML